MTHEKLPVRVEVHPRLRGSTLHADLHVNDHDDLRHDPVLALFADKLDSKRADCALLAGKSTLNRLEHAAAAG
jgi:hypothetical protein